MVLDEHESEMNSSESTLMGRCGALLRGCWGLEANWLMRVNRFWDDKELSGR